MNWLAKLWCFIRGHDFVRVPFEEIDNGRSKFGEYQCARCDRRVPWQWDYRV